MTVTASAINIPFEALLDRTACLVPDVQVYTAGSDTWTKPVRALFCEIVLVGSGGDGGDGGGGGLGGGGGGGAGGIEVWRGAAALLPSSLSIDVKAGGSGLYSSVTGTGFGLYAHSGDNGSNSPGLDQGGAGGDGGAPFQPTIGAFASPDTAAAGGAAGDPGENPVGWRFGGAAGGGGGDSGSAPPNRGGTGGQSYGGTSSTPSAGTGGGPAGGGYGAGGGGGGGTAGSGGAGAGGYGGGSIATAGQSDAGGGGGGVGAGGICVITTWRGVAV